MNKKLISKFGKNLKKIRLNKKLSQEELAEKAGLHRTYIGMVERGEKNITLSSMEKITRSLNISLSQLLKKL